MNGDIRELREEIRVITTQLNRLEGALQPSQWRNDRPPEGREEADDGKVWCWYCGGIRPIHGQMVRSLCAAGSRPWWAPGNQPAPTSPPPEPQPEPAPTGWITDRVPTAEDGDSDDEVRVPERFGLGYTWIHWKYVHPGTPWSRTGAEPGPWDPTTLNHNGWIRSRLPTKKDAGPDWGMVCIPGDASGYSWQHYTFVTHGQPWAPCGSSPGTYQP